MYAVLCIRRYSFYIFSVQCKCIHFRYTELCAIIVDHFCLHTFSRLKILYSKVWECVSHQFSYIII